MEIKRHPLDNPIFYALKTYHSSLGLGKDGACRYQPDILPFVGVADQSLSTVNAMNDLLEAKESFFLFGEMNGVLDNWKGLAKLNCLQMVLESPRALLHIENPPEKLGMEHKDEIFELVNLVQPGYFRNESIRLGRYFGIFNQGQLVSVGGERMRMPGFTEISAICTLPEFRGRGHAQEIILQLCIDNLKGGHIPFLHVLETNTLAIRVYEKLGFQVRRVMEVRQFVKN